MVLRDLPYFRGTIPNKLASIMAAGLPVICAVNGDAGQVVEAAGAGWTAAAGDVHGLAQAFRAAYSASSAELAAAGASARAYYEQYLSRDANTAEIEQLLATAYATAPVARRVLFY